MSIEIQKNMILCVGCNGAKTVPIYEDGVITGYKDCASCEGTGAMQTSWAESYNENTFESYKVLEEIDITEYNALTDIKKAGIKILLSCGIVDLNDGKAGKVRLWNWFGAESTTVANLIALLG